jgi:DNA-binding MarR family transcriptional regulator
MSEEKKDFILNGLSYNLLESLTPQEIKVYIILYRYKTMKNGVFPSLEKIAECYGSEKRTVINILNKMESAKIIHRSRRFGKTNLYTITEKKADQEAETSIISCSEKKCTLAEDNQCKKMHVESEKKCTENNIIYNKVNQCQGQSACISHAPACTNARTHEESNRKSKYNIDKKSFIDFPIKNSFFQREQELGNDIAPFNKYAPDNVYLRGLFIGYRMTLDEVMKFIKVYLDGGYYDKKGKFHQVRSFERLLESFKKNQDPVIAAQAIEERSILAGGGEITSDIFMEYADGKEYSYIRRKPFPELDLDGTYTSYVENNSPFEDDDPDDQFVRAIRENYL